MEFKQAFDNLTKEENVLLPDEEGMSKEELVEEFKNRQQYIDEAMAQVRHLTSFRPATKNRMVARGNKAKDILRREISKLENEIKAPKKKKKKIKYDKEGKLTPEEISFILSPESSFNVDPGSLQRGGKRKTRRKRKTKKSRRKGRKTKKRRKRKTRKKRGRGKVSKKDRKKMTRKLIPPMRKIKNPGFSGAKANLVPIKAPHRGQSALRMFRSRINEPPAAASAFNMSDIQRALPQQQQQQQPLVIPSDNSDNSEIDPEIQEIMNSNEQVASKQET